ncbi:MAG: ABC transporter permease, partial [Ruminococcus sp.]|nr:ABC transporter permease [Ruminococcus sp.]
QYLAYIFICILILGVAPCLMRLDSEELRRRIICAPVASASKTAQMALGAFTVVGGVWLAFMALAAIVYGSEMFTRSGLLCMGNSLCYIIMAAGITLLVAQFNLSDNILSMVSNVISLGMSFLCGVFVPQEFLGDGVLTAAHALPAYWYIRANNMLCGMSEEPFSGKLYLTCIGIQLGMAAVLFVAAGIVSAMKKR